MILKRGFIDVKRLATVCVNNVIRQPWLLDYIKCISKPLEYTNGVQVSYSKTMAEYVLFNGQKLSLKTYVDDKVDLVDRRTIIEEDREEGYSFYGYYNNNKEFELEVDPNETTFNGYATYTLDDYSFTLEGDLSNPVMYGYVKWSDLDALQDVVDEFILDNYEEYIYTSDNDTSNDNYIYFLEQQTGEGLIIYIHNDIYTSMTQIQKDELLGIIDRYIISPNRFKLDGYN